MKLSILMKIKFNCKQLNFHFKKKYLEIFRSHIGLSRILKHGCTILLRVQECLEFQRHIIHNGMRFRKCHNHCIVTQLPYYEAISKNVFRMNRNTHDSVWWNISGIEIDWLMPWDHYSNAKVWCNVFPWCTELNDFHIK